MDPIDDIMNKKHVRFTYVQAFMLSYAHQVAKLQSTGKETHDPISVIQCFPESQFLSIGTPSLRLWIRTKKKRIEMKIRRRRTPCPKVGPA
jgi:hypothetical protein